MIVVYVTIGNSNHGNNQPYTEKISSPVIDLISRTPVSINKSWKAMIDSGRDPREAISFCVGLVVITVVVYGYINI